MNIATLLERADRTDLPPFAALRAFDAVGRCGGIRKAAALLNIDHTVISRHLRALESWLGVTLYERSHGSGLTEIGEQYYARISVSLQELAAATDEIRRGCNTTTLRIFAVPGFGVNWLAGRLPSFTAMHPTIDLEFRPTDDPPDFLRQEADVDIRFAPTLESLDLPKAVRATELIRPGGYVVSSPDYLARVGPLRLPSDLLKCTLIHEESTKQWRNFFAGCQVPIPERLRGPRMWAASAVLEAACAGEGIALTNDFIIRDNLEAGRLVKVELEGMREKAERRQRGGAYWLIAAESRWMRSPIIQFRRWLAIEMALPEMTNGEGAQI